MKIFTGTVTSKKMQKTATVVVNRVIVHPVYKKRVRRMKKYQVHDDLNAVVGQVVKFAASKPYSKTVKWNLLEIVGVKKDVNKKISGAKAEAELLKTAEVEKKVPVNKESSKKTKK